MNTAPSPPPRDEIPHRFAREMRTLLGENLRQLVLYGSRARGDAAADSDYDFLAVVDHLHPGLKDSLYDLAGDFLYHHDAVISIIPVAEHEFHRRLFNPLFINVRREGIAL